MSQRLQEIIKLRCLLRDFQQQIESIMPDAILEALARFENRENTKSQIVYEDSTGKIVLSFRKHFCKEEEVPALARLDADIKAAIAQLAIKHALELQAIESQIEQLQEAIADLESKRESLLSSNYISKLQEQHKILVCESADVKPILSVYLT